MTPNYLRVYQGKKTNSKKSNLKWHYLNTEKEKTIPFEKEVLFIPNGASKAAVVIFLKTDQGCRICMDHSIFIRYKGQGFWTELPRREDLRDDTY